MFIKFETAEGPVFHECQNAIFKNDPYSLENFGRTGHKFYSYNKDPDDFSSVTITTSDDTIINIGFDRSVYLLNNDGNTIWTKKHK